MAKAIDETKDETPNTREVIEQTAKKLGACAETVASLSFSSDRS